jgi:hypothetical protein
LYRGLCCLILETSHEPFSECNHKYQLTFSSIQKIPLGAFSVRGRDSSVGIATHYGLEGPGIESRWGRDFLHASRPALGSVQIPIQWVPCLSRG